MSRPTGSLPARAAEARRNVLAPTGGTRLMQPVVEAEPAEIREHLAVGAVLLAADELIIFRPPGFSHRDNVVPVENIAELVAADLGWTPAR